MKYLKQKLMAAAAMLAVSAVMLTSASYAWFTISVTPEVKTVETTVTANENFEIALGTDKATTPDEYAATAANNVVATNTTTNNYTWGATVTFSSALTGIGPAKVVNDAIQTVTYGTDGRPSGLSDATRALKGTTPTTIANGTAVIKDLEGNVIGQTILIWLRTNKAGGIKVDVSGVEFNVSNANPATDRKELVKTAFEVCEFDSTNNTVKPGSKIVVAGEPDANGVRTADLTAANETFAANTEIPVLVHIYLDGDNTLNSDVAFATDKVRIASIKFTNKAITATNAYDHQTLNNPNAGGAGEGQ